MSAAKAISVTRLVRRMKNLLEIELGEIWVEGEISNIRKQSSGHQYFTLKDEGGQIPCVLFRGNAVRLNFDLEDGMQVILFAEASVYEARGQVQLIIRKVERQGRGDLQKKFDDLKAKLAAEGLFDKKHKRKLPEFPTTIGLITSESSAALQDMLNILKRRAPWVQPVLYPVKVQGDGAEMEIAQAIRNWSEDLSLPKVDLLIVGRGGGSIEDLWNFNEEVVARAIVNSSVPVISAVGHEIDFTIADFVADLRAPTPSAAVELAVPDGNELSEKVNILGRNLDQLVQQRLDLSKLLLAKFRESLLAKSPESFLRESVLRIENLSSELEIVVTRKIEEEMVSLKMLDQKLRAFKPDLVIERLRSKVKMLASRFDSLMDQKIANMNADFERLSGLHRALGPDSMFARGFSVTKTDQGKIIRKISDVRMDQEIITTVKDGEIRSRIKH